MTEQFFKFPAPYIASTKKKAVPIITLKPKEYKSWAKKQSKSVQKRLEIFGLSGVKGEAASITNTQGEITKIVFIVSSPVSLYDGALISKKLSGTIDEALMKKTVFEFDTNSLTDQEIEKLVRGWVLQAYSFDLYKTSGDSAPPVLLLPKTVNKKDLQNTLNPVFTLRNIVNTPANDFGPDEMESVCEQIADKYKAKFNVVSGEDLLQKNYPLVHLVGKVSPREPRLIELKWGKASDPKVTLVGKGVCYDTGGLSLKPTRSMLLMRKDMSGAAHALALAELIMAHKLPIQLRVLIPAVDNDVSGGAMRPGDIMTSRKGLTVEITNTDAEGRLILADALTAASEDDPDLIIDYATLTGAKMAALGHDISAYFGNNQSIVKELQKHSVSEQDPLWPFPIWKDYQSKIESQTADLSNSALAPGDLLYSALFLYQFIDPKIDWIHFDIYGWENTAKAGRSYGAKECGLRAMFSYLKDRYQ